MIKVNTSHIGDEPLFFDGTETRDILDLNAAPEAPEMTAVSDITYQLYASKTGQDLLVNGSATFDLETTCARCMKKIVIPVTSATTPRRSATVWTSMSVPRARLTSAIPR